MYQVPTIYRYVLVLLYLVGMSVCSLVPSSGLAARLPEQLSQVDKLFHAAGYAVLTGLLLWAHGGKHALCWYNVLGIAAIATGAGAGMEFWQDFIGTRFFSVADIVANGCGAMLAGVGLYLARSFRACRANWLQ